MGTIRVSFTASIDDDYASYNINPEPLEITKTGVGRFGHDQIIGTVSEELIDFGDVTTEGFCYLRNLDDTNFVQYGPKSGETTILCCRLNPGEYAWLRLEPAIEWYAQADTGNVQLRVDLLED
jgi:hypothetical protein